MKKSLKVISVLMAALAIGSFAGCKPAVSGDDFGSVAGGKGKAGPNTIVFDLKDAKADIDWFCWTKRGADSKNNYKAEIVDSGITLYEAEYELNSKGKPTDAVLIDTSKPITIDSFGTKPTKLLKNKLYVFKFEKAGGYNFYMHEVGAEKDKAGSVEFKDQESKKLLIKDSSWKEIDQQGAVYIKNNEVIYHRPSQGGDSFFQKGDYTITEVWPLEKTTIDKEYKVAEELKYTSLDMKKNETKGFLFPAKDLMIAIKQPNRSKDALKYKLIYRKDNIFRGVPESYTNDQGKIVDYKEGDIYYPDGRYDEKGNPITGYTVAKITQEDINAKDAEFWGYPIKVPVHAKATFGDTNANFIESSSLGTHKFNVEKDTFTDISGKSAVPGYSYLVESDSVIGEK